MSTFPDAVVKETLDDIDFFVRLEDCLRTEPEAIRYLVSLGFSQEDAENYILALPVEVGSL